MTNSLVFCLGSPRLGHQLLPAADSDLRWIPGPSLSPDIDPQKQERTTLGILHTTNRANWLTPVLTLPCGERGWGLCLYLMRTSCPWVGMSASTFPQMFSTNCHSPSLSPMVASEGDQKSRRALTECPGSDGWDMRPPDPGPFYTPPDARHLVT